MIVVSDTTPLNYLLLVEAIDILPKLFQHVHVPRSVIAELSQARASEIVKQSNAISLAKELHIQDILIDERRGRKIAQSEGMTPLPTLAILERAAVKNFIDLPTVLHAFEKTTIRIPRDRIDAVILRDQLRKKNQR